MLLQENIQLSYEVLCTLMAEVTAIMNARPLIPVSTDLDSLLMLTPAMILTQKVGVPPPPGDFNDKDLLHKQWRQVQALANKFYIYNTVYYWIDDILIVFSFTLFSVSLLLHIDKHIESALK